MIKAMWISFYRSRYNISLYLFISCQ